ncbi:MAG: hypothetical protein ACI8WB_002021 [Phenylobacterium sp.]|jgi:hypothetical protein
MSVNASDPLAQSLNGFGWVLRPFKNSSGLLSVLLIFITVWSLWLVSMVSWQFKQHYFDELRGIYPPIFTKANHNHDWPALKNHLSAITAVRKEHFTTLVDVCIDDNKDVGFRPVRTGIRTLAAPTLIEQSNKYQPNGQAGVWMSSTLYEVIFGHPYAESTSSPNDNHTLTLVARLKRRSQETLNHKTCQTNGAKITLPIIKVLPLATPARWLILRKADLPQLNISKKLTPVTSIYTSANGNAERAVVNAINLYLQQNKQNGIAAKVNYWIDELPFSLQVQREKLDIRFTLFAFLNCAMMLFFMIGFYLIQQKALQENLYLLRYYGVSKKSLFGHASSALTLFWLSLYVLGFVVAWQLLTVTQAKLFVDFNPLDYLHSFINGLTVLLLLSPGLLALLYLYYHFWTPAFNQQWKDSQL